MGTRVNLYGAWRYRVWLVLGVAAAGATYVFTSAAAQNEGPNAMNRAPAVLRVPLGERDLSNLFAQFRSISSLCFRADVEVALSQEAASCCFGLAIQPGNPIVADNGSIIVPAIFGEMGYWASGDRYRVNNYLDPALYPGMDTQFAYDGQRFQLLRPSAGTLSYSSEDNNVILMTLPNPILELLQFCYPVTDANFQFRLRLKDIMNARAPVDLQGLIWEVIHEEGSVLHRTQCPGGTYEGRQYVHHVYAAPKSHHKPLRIDRITADGTRITSSEFSRYIEVTTANGPTFWPQSVALRAFDAEGNQAAMVSFNITEFSLNAPVRQDIFTISTKGVEGVWDDDLREFVQ